MSTWEQLDAFLDSVTRRLGGDAYLLSDSSKLKLSPPDVQDDELMARFERGCQALREKFGIDCLRTGSWRRHFSHEPANWFVAEPVLTVYHLIVVFAEDYSSDVWLAHVLDQVRGDLGDMIAGLPPLDGGGRSAGAAGG